MDRKFEFEGKSKKTDEQITGDLIHGIKGDMYICTVSEEEEFEMQEVYPESVSLIKGNSPGSGRRAFGNGIPIW